MNRTIFSVCLGLGVIVSAFMVETGSYFWQCLGVYLFFSGVGFWLSLISQDTTVSKWVSVVVLPFKKHLEKEKDTLAVFVCSVKEDSIRGVHVDYCQSASTSLAALYKMRNALDKEIDNFNGKRFNQLNSEGI